MRLLQTSDKLTPTSASSSSSQVIPSTGLALLRLSPGNQSQVSSTTMETVSFNNEPLKLPSEIDSSSSMTSINKVHFQFGSMVLTLNNNNQINPELTILISATATSTERQNFGCGSVLSSQCSPKSSQHHKSTIC